MNCVLDQIKLEPLIVLRNYFKTLPENYSKFNMHRHAIDRIGMHLYPQDVPECGTSMCLLGHLPLLGYPGLEDEDWNQYACRVLNINFANSYEEDVIWDYLFSGFWSSNVVLAIQRLDDVINKRKSIIVEHDYETLYEITDNYNSLLD